MAIVLFYSIYHTLITCLFTYMSVFISSTLVGNFFFYFDISPWITDLFLFFQRTITIHCLLHSPLSLSLLNIHSFEGERGGTPKHSSELQLDSNLSDVHITKSKCQFLPLIHHNEVIFTDKYFRLPEIHFCLSFKTLFSFSSASTSGNLR